MKILPLISIFSLLIIIFFGCNKNAETNKEDQPIEPSLNSQRILRIAGIPEAPLKYISDGKPTGIDIDIIEYIMEKIGI